MPLTTLTALIESNAARSCKVFHMFNVHYGGGSTEQQIVWCSYSWLAVKGLVDDLI
jgi:hypothetical protein